MVQSYLQNTANMAYFISLLFPEPLPPRIPLRSHPKATALTLKDHTYSDTGLHLRPIHTILDLY